MDNEVYSKLELNAVIKIKLRENGISILRDEHNYCLSRITDPMVRHYFGEFVEPCVDENGYTEMKLWQFMSTFGNYCFFEGTQEDELSLPFEPEILINHETLVLFEDKSKKLKNKKRK